MAWEDRAAIFLRASELARGPWRATLNAVTMLNLSKTVREAEIDAACETADYLAVQRPLHARDVRDAAGVAAGNVEPNGVPPA